MLHDVLSEAHGGALGSIVRPFQAKQDEIIRASDSIVVVQGVAGTGKTVVALYRSRIALPENSEEA
jgi:DNA helicase IV